MEQSTSSQLSIFKIRCFQRLVSLWFKGHGRCFPWRKKSLSIYQKIIVESLLQRTRAETVAAFYPHFIEVYPSWTVLAKATAEELQSFLKPIGLWRRRAVSLMAFAQAMAKRNGRFPVGRAEIEKLPSVGQYMANAILLFCHGESQPLLDAGMARVLERVFGARVLSDIRTDPYLQSLAKAIVTCDEPIKMNWAILDIASVICKTKDPRCWVCPLNMICCYYETEYEKVGEAGGQC